MGDLLKMKCEACHKGVPAATETEITEFLLQAIINEGGYANAAA